MAALWTISGSCCDFSCTSDWSIVNPLHLPGFLLIPGLTWPFPLATLSLVTQAWDSQELIRLGHQWIFWTGLTQTQSTAAVRNRLLGASDSCCARRPETSS